MDHRQNKQQQLNFFRIKYAKISSPFWRFETPGMPNHCARRERQNQDSGNAPAPTGSFCGKKFCAGTDLDLG
jgi:hypothetical protein